MALKTILRDNRLIKSILLVLILTACQITFAQELSLSPGNKIVLRTAVFQSDSDSLDNALVASLKDIGEYLQQRPDLKVEIVGHSDSTGKMEYNEDLALRRARRVKQFLSTKYFIPEGNIVIRGFGSRFPLESNTTEEGRAKNRRVEIVPVTSLTHRTLTDQYNKPKNAEGQLSFFNGTVQTKAPWEIGFGDAFLEEPIYEMHKINTRNQARAEVTFNDYSRLQVGENSLVIIYGLESKEPAIKEKGNIELVKGDLLAKLRALQNEQQYVIKTPSAQMSFTMESKSKLAVDKVDRSTVSMFEGKTEVSAAGKSIEVPENYGTQVYRDAPPETPRKLADPPAVISPEKNFLPWNKDGVTFSWKSNSYAAKLEISTDTNFNALLWSVTTRKNLSKVNLEDGEYYWHLQGIDSVGLEGKPMETRLLIVKKYNYDRARLNLLTVNEGLNTVDDPDVVISGTADQHSTVRINGEQLKVDQNGTFNRRIHLLEGDNTFVVDARDSLGFDNSKTIIYRYTPSRRFGFTLGFSPLVLPNKYGSLKVGGDVALKFPQLFSSNQNFGINLMVGEFMLSNPYSDSVPLNSKSYFRPYGIAELLLTVEGSRDNNVIPFMEVTSGAFLWPKYRGDYYSTTSGISYVAGLGIGLRTNGPSSAFGVLGTYRWIVSDYKRFDPFASKGIHGMFDLQLAYFIY